MLKIDLAGSTPVRTVACDRRKVQARPFHNTIPTPDQYEVSVGAMDVFWAEYRKDGTAEKTSLFRAPK